MNEKIKKYLPGGGFVFILVFCATFFFIYHWVDVSPVIGNTGAAKNAKNGTVNNSLLTNKTPIFYSPIVQLERFLNFGDREGPYPQKRIPEIRWGLGPDSTLILHSSEKRSAILVLKVCNPQFNRQVVEITCNEAVMGEITFDKKNMGEFSEARLPIQLEKGVNKILFKYSHWDSDKHARRKLALMFSGIEITQKQE